MERFDLEEIQSDLAIVADKLTELEDYPIKAGRAMQEAWEFIMNAQDAIDRALEHVPDDEN